MGSADCERLRDGWLAQPFNALTSLAFAVEGATMLRHARQSPHAQRIGLAAATVTTGVGSFAFHGPQPRGAHQLHDGSMTWLLLQVLQLHYARPEEPRTRSTYLMTCAAGVGALCATKAGRTNAAVGGAAAAIAAKELGALCRGRRKVHARGGHYARALAALSAGVAALALGRTGSPLCDPDRFVQVHGLWHVAAAIALDGYVRAVDRPPISSS